MGPQALAFSAGLFLIAGCADRHVVDFDKGRIRKAAP